LENDTVNASLSFSKVFPFSAKRKKKLLSFSKVFPFFPRKKSLNPDQQVSPLGASRISAPQLSSSLYEVIIPAA